jgi:hypothetical protein
MEEVKGKSEIIMRIEKPKNKQVKGIRYAKDYFYFE